MIKFIKNIFSRSEPSKEIKFDYSHIDSREKALEGEKRGELFPILMFPEIFGGENVEENTLYVPPGIPQIQNQMIATIARFVEQGLVDNMRVVPEYRGASFIPVKIAMETQKDGKAGRFNPTIEIW